MNTNSQNDKEEELKWNIWWEMMEQGFITTVTDRRGRSYECRIDSKGRFRMKCLGGQLKMKI